MRLRPVREWAESVTWEDATDLSRWVRLARNQARLYFYILRELVRDRCLQQAAALTFTTLLSLVPLLAVAFSLYRSFAGIEGVADRAQDAIFEFLLARPLVERSVWDEAQTEEALEGQSEPASAPASLQAAGERAGQGDTAGALRLYVAALDLGADPGEVRQALSRIRLPDPQTAARLVRGLSENAGEGYRAAAGLPTEAARSAADTGQAANRDLRTALDLYSHGDYDGALGMLRLAEQKGASPAETRDLAGRTHRQAARALGSQGNLDSAAKHWSLALLSYTDAVMLAALQRRPKSAEGASARHEEARQEMGDLLLKLGQQEAEFYRSLRENGAVATDGTLQSALNNLGEAAALLDDPAPAHLALADLLWDQGGRLDEAREHYRQAAEHKRNGAARGISSVAADYIRTFIDRVGQVRLGIVATLVLIVTATSLFGSVEKTLNSIWKTVGKRPFWIKFTSFWTLICLGPAVIGVAIWVRETMGRFLASAFGDVPVLGLLVSAVTLAGRLLVPLVTAWLLLVAVYIFLPHTRVKFGPAAWGAFVASVLLQCARPLFTLYVLGTVKYEAIYGSLGMIPIFLLWLWLLWVIVLFGAEVSFTIQNLGLLRYHDKLRRLSGMFIERHLAARIMLYVAREFSQSGQPLSVGQLARTLRIAPEEAADAANRLVKLGMLTPVGEACDAFHPARDLSRVTVSDVLSISDRLRDESRSPALSDRPYEDRLEQAFRSAAEAQEAALGGTTLEDLLRECDARASKPGGAGKQTPAGE